MTQKQVYQEYRLLIFQMIFLELFINSKLIWSYIKLHNQRSVIFVTITYLFIAGAPDICSIYILQPEAVRMREGGGRGHRKYDRGRSFSPPKGYLRKSFRDPAAGPTREPMASSGFQKTQLGQHIAGSGVQQIASARHQTPGRQQQLPEMSQQTGGSAPQYASYTNLPSKFRHNESFRKSLSSDQLFAAEKPIQENNFISLSSRSSNTSTGMI